MDANCSGGSGASSASGPQEDAASLRREVGTLHSALRLQSSALAREQQRASGLAVKLAHRDHAQDARRAHADRQAAALLRALLVLEATLRKEQSTIQQKLKLKDQQIVRQREEIQKLKRERRTHCSNCQQLIGFTSEQTNIETDPEFHSLDSVETQKVFGRSMSYHESNPQPFQKNSRLSKSFQQSKNEIKYGNTSSSEEVFEANEAGETQGKGTYVKNKQAFVRKDVTRRSRKCSGRRHSSVYLDSVQKRPSRSQFSSSSAEDGPHSEKDSKLFHPDGDENCDIGEEISKDIERASNRIDQLLNNPNSPTQFDDDVQSRLLSRNVKERTFGSQIDNMHGIRKSSRETTYHHAKENGYLDVKDANGNPENPWYTNVSDPEPELECAYGSAARLVQNRSMSADDILSSSHKTTGNSTDNNVIYRANLLQIESPVSTSNNESNSDKENNQQQKSVKNQNHKCSNKDNVKNEAGGQRVYEACNNKFDSEQNENWYASASDPDDDPSCEIYKNNPVLECVNQILLQNSLDENSSDVPRVYDSPSPKASTKRVQFSTLNSISFDESVGKNGDDCPKNYPKELQRAPQERRSAHKIVKFSLETSSEHSYEVPNPTEAFNFEVQSIYSNDYEPIITKPDDLDDIGNKLKAIPVPLPRTLNNMNKGTDTASKKNTVVKNMAKSLENRINGNHYVDMDSKYVSLPSTLTKRKVPRVPPALPPKPKNLVSKFKLTNQPQSGPSSLPGNVAAAMNSDPVASNQRTADVPGVKVKNASGSAKSSVSGEPDYCSISEINVPVVSCGKRGLISTEATVEIHAEKFTPNIAEKRSLPKLATISKLSPNKMNDKDIPKLPQVTEIIIPDDDDITDAKKKSHETYAAKPPLNPAKKDLRNSIQIGHSVSTILTDIKNRSASIEDVNKCIMANDINKSFVNGAGPKQVFQSTERSSLRLAEKSRLDLPIFETVESECEKFDLSQNFEEFKIDDCEFTNIGAEEYRISSETSDASSSDCAADDANANVAPKLTEGPYKIEFTSEDDLNAKNLALNAAGLDSSKAALKIYSKLSNKPDLLSNIDSVETDSVRYSDLESSNSSSSNCGSYNTVKCEPSTFVKDAAPSKTEPKHALPFEYFLESSGLSSKSILTPSRPPNANHKSVQKPRDVKMKSKTQFSVGRVTPLYEKCGPNTAIKYFEPYL